MADEPDKPSGNTRGKDGCVCGHVSAKGAIHLAWSNRCVCGSPCDPTCQKDGPANFERWEAGQQA